METFLHWLQSYGYFGLAIGVFLESVGVPVPGETALLVASFAAARGSLRLSYVILVAAGAGILGDNLGYFLGRRLGRRWLLEHGRRFFLPPERLAQMERFFDRFGAAAVALARFVTGVRVVAAFSAGVARLRWVTFLVFNILGATVWATTIGLLGYAAGLGISALGLRPWMLGAIVVAVVAVLVAGAFLRRRLREPLRRLVAQTWLRRLVWWEVWVLALSLSGLILFAKIAEDVVEQEAGPFDAAVAHWMLTHPVVPVPVAATVGWLGSTLVLVPLTLALGAVLWIRTRRSATFAVSVAPLLGSAIVLGLKAGFHRAYPSVAGLGAMPPYSFPSLHATLITAVAITLGYVLVRQRIVRWPGAAAVALPVVLAVGTARVYLDLDRATDVLGGWAVGLFVAAVTVTLYEQSRTGRPSSRASPPD